MPLHRTPSHLATDVGLLAATLHRIRSHDATDVGLLAATRHPRCNQRPATGMFDPAIMPRLLPCAARAKAAVQI